MSDRGRTASEKGAGYSALNRLCSLLINKKVLGVLTITLLVRVVLNYTPLKYNLFVETYDKSLFAVILTIVVVCLGRRIKKEHITSPHTGISFFCGYLSYALFVLARRFKLLEFLFNNDLLRFVEQTIESVLWIIFAAFIMIFTYERYRLMRADPFNCFNNRSVFKTLGILSASLLGVRFLSSASYYAIGNLRPLAATFEPILFLTNDLIKCAATLLALGIAVFVGAVLRYRMIHEKIASQAADVVFLFKGITFYVAFLFIALSLLYSQVQAWQSFKSTGGWDNTSFLLYYVCRAMRAALIQIIMFILPSIGIIVSWSAIRRSADIQRKLYYVYLTFPAIIGLFWSASMAGFTRYTEYPVPLAFLMLLIITFGVAATSAFRIYERDSTLCGYHKFMLVLALGWSPLYVAMSGALGVWRHIGP
jgi:hypothetical protein